MEEFGIYFEGRAIGLVEELDERMNGYVFNE